MVVQPPPKKKRYKLPERKRPKRTPRPNTRDLARYEAFAHAYLAIGTPTYLNAAASARQCGYGKMYSERYGYKMLRRLPVQQAMKRVRDERARLSTVCTPIEVLEILSAQARITPECFVDENGDVLPLKAGDTERAKAIAGIKRRTRTYYDGDEPITENVIEYKLIDRQKAAEILAKHHGLFEKDNAQGRPEPAVVQIVNAPPPMSLEEWEKQAQEVHKRMIERKATVPAPENGNGNGSE